MSTKATGPCLLGTTATFSSTSPNRDLEFAGGLWPLKEMDDESNCIDGETSRDTPARHDFPDIGPFLALTFALTWGLAALLVFFPDQLEAIFGPVGYTNPLYILAVYAPTFAAVFLVWRHYGVKGLGSFFRRLTLWRMPVPWWVFLVLGVPALFYLAAAITGTITDPFPFSPWYAVLPALGLMLVLGPVEEFGWRGVALPLLQRRFAPLWAGLILGAVWGLWHLPAFFLGGTVHSKWRFASFFLGAMTLSVIMTAMFNEARGSILTAALLHFQLNNPIWPDAMPWDLPVFAIAAVVIVILNDAPAKAGGFESH